MSVEYNGKNYKIKYKKAANSQKYMTLKIRGKEITNITELKGLENLIDLESLDLNDNNIAEINGIENLINLKILFLNQNQITEIKGLENLTNLENLSLNQNQISKIRGLENLINLKRLHLGSNQISDIKNLVKLKNLESLWLSSNQISRTLDFGPKKTLKLIQIGDNPIFTQIKSWVMEKFNEKLTIGLITNKIIIQHFIEYGWSTYTNNKDKKNDLDYIAQGKEFFIHKKFSKAIESFDNAIKINPNSVEARNLKGRLLILIRNFEDAMKCFEEVLKLEYSNQDAWLNRGNIYEELDQFNEALICYEKVSEFFPNDSNIAKRIENFRIEFDSIKILDIIIKINKFLKHSYLNQNQFHIPIDYFSLFSKFLKVVKKEDIIYSTLARCDLVIAGVNVREENSFLSHLLLTNDILAYACPDPSFYLSIKLEDSLNYRIELSFIPWHMITKFWKSSISYKSKRDLLYSLRVPKILRKPIWIHHKFTIIRQENHESNENFLERSKNFGNLCKLLWARSILKASLKSQIYLRKVLVKRKFKSILSELYDFN